MKVKSIEFLRKQIWQSPYGGNKEQSINYNFIGSFANHEGEVKQGFFKMYHGIKEDIAGFLPSILKIAEDGQAIYEFIQNAVDCDSTHFYIFYNEKYFLAINNGEAFDTEGIKSILNIAQTTKRSCDKIGRFGIGFKLAHRLVGKTEGIDELVKQYKGPILFSWSNREDLKKLLAKENIEAVEPSNGNSEDTEYSKLPYLTKLLLTNFPASPNEIVKNLDYKNSVLFPQSELDELIDFTNENFAKHAQNFAMENLNQGSLFFIKLGEGKDKILDTDYEDLKKGTQYSMNTLKKLKNIFLNTEFIEKQPLELEEFEIAKESNEFKLINPEYKDCDIKITFGYYKNYKDSEKLKESPNFYKYFPMGDEVNGFNFIVHCDSFSNESNRRKLQADDVNKQLLPVIATFITEKLDGYKINDRKKFLDIYASLILSNVPNKQNNDWLQSIFYDIILAYLQNNIPTQNNAFSNNSNNVKINNLKIDIKLSDFGLNHIEWFEWKRERDFDIVKEAQQKEKLEIENWYVEDLILNGNTSNINNWFKSISDATFNDFVSELRIINTWQDNNNALFNKFCTLKYLKFSNSEFYSIEDQSKFTNVLILNPQLLGIKDILVKLGFVVSERVVPDGDKASNLSILIHSKVDYLKSGVVLYEKICSWNKNHLLNAYEKKRLFLFFQKLQGIGDVTLQKLILFVDNQNVPKPLSELINSNFNTPNWLNPYKIKAEENFSELKDLLLKEEDIYQQVIFPKWDSIISTITNISDFYKSVKAYYLLKENMPVLDKKQFVFVDNEGFLPPTDVFYNSNFLSNKNYKEFQNAIYTLTGYFTPSKGALEFLKTPPFKIVDEKLFDIGNNEKIELDSDSVKLIIDFCRANGEQFFQNLVVEKVNSVLTISSKLESVYQVRPRKELVSFINNELSNIFKILPLELYDYEEENGIIKGENLYKLILNNVDVDDYSIELVDLIFYDEPKKNFLQQLSEIRFKTNSSYNKDSYEYKLLMWICNSSVLKEEDYADYREKIIIETEEGISLSLSEIPLSKDTFTIDKYELSLANVLPKTHSNSNYLSNLLDTFINLDISKEKLQLFFGINEELNFGDILVNLKSETNGNLINASQVCFVILYHKFVIEDKKYNDTGYFKCQTANNEWHSIHTKYTNFYSFILESEIFAPNYNDNINKILSLGNKMKYFLNGYEEIIYKPYFTESEFICTYLKDNLIDNEKIDFIEFLFKEWNKHNKKQVIQNINWSKIDGKETKQILGFDPNFSVYPNEIAIESEYLPIYLQNWINKEQTKINFLTDLGVWTEQTTLGKLRKFFKNELEDFKLSSLAEGGRFSDGKMLINTFEWLKVNNLGLEEKKIKTFEEIVRVINSNRSTTELKIEKEIHFDLLEQESIEWSVEHYINWKTQIDNKFSIYLREGLIPKTIKVNEIEDYIFYNFSEDDVCINITDNKIYVNSNSNIESTLQKIVSQDLFTYEHLYKLFNNNASIEDSQKETEELKKVIIQLENNSKIIEIKDKEINELKARIDELEGFSKIVTHNPTITKDQTYNNEIKEKSEKYLYQFLKIQYPNHIVKWLNFDEKTLSFKESGENHDFKIISKNGKILHYIDCKATPENKKTFYITNREWSFFLKCLENRESYQIYRVFNLNNNAEHIHIDNLEEWIKKGKVVPYLMAKEIIEGGRVFLTLQ